MTLKPDVGSDFEAVSRADLAIEFGSKPGNKGMDISPEGWCRGVRRVLSPNCDSRPSTESRDISLLVIHNISLPPGEFGGPYIEQLFTNCLPAQEHPYFVGLAGLEVSAHLLIDRGGECTQFVAFDERAWHAGESSFEGRECCNDFAVGIELEGTDTSGYTDVQYLVLAEISRALMVRYPAISRERIVGHCDIAPGRKTDPGPGFDWRRFFALVDGAD